MAKKESVLSQSEKDSFEIEKFIFHIINRDQIDPIYLDEIELDSSQILFFKERFVDVSEGVQHIFHDKEHSSLYQECMEMIQTPSHFLEISRQITASFKSHHNKNTNNGVFITSLVKVQSTRYLIFLIKLDHKKVYEYTIDNKRALLHEITDTFIEDKKAIQKSALIDVSDYYNWSVLATDRAANGKTALTKYFSDFLSVVEKETPSKLTEKAVQVIKQWAIANRIELDPNQDLSTYKKRGIDYLNSTSKFKTNDYINAVVQDENDSRKQKLIASFKDFCDECGLSGQSFVPNKNSISKKMKKNIRKTAEGVKIEWEGDAKDSNVEIPSSVNKNDGLYHIIIKTNQIEILD